MANIKISNLTTWTGTPTDIKYFIMNNAGNTETYKVSGYTSLVEPGSGTGSIKSLNYTSANNSNDYGVLLGGTNNQMTSGQRGAIIGGYNNQSTTYKNDIFIGGGNGNSVNGDYSGVIGGFSNTNTSIKGFMGGGESNTLSGNRNWTLGGLNTTNSANYGGLFGGENNFNAGDYNALLGGSSNNITGGLYMCILNGETNRITNGLFSNVLGGASNTHNNGNYSSIVAGNGNSMLGNSSGVFVGETNVIDNADYSAIIAGSNTDIPGLDYSVMVGTSGRTALYSATTHVENIHTFKTESFKEYNGGNVGGSIDVDCSQGSFFLFTMTADTTPNFINVRNGQRFFFIVYNNGSWAVPTATLNGASGKVMAKNGSISPGNNSYSKYVATYDSVNDLLFLDEETGFSAV